MCSIHLKEHVPSGIQFYSFPVKHCVIQMVISQCMIENDSFQRKNVLHIGQQKC